MIVVTGMHRSGTSFTCNLLHAMEADCGAEQLLLPKDRWNERGYFENIEVIELNNRLILGNGSASLYDRVLHSHWREPFKVHARSLLNLPAFLFPNPGNIPRRAVQCMKSLQRLSEKYRDTVVKDVRFSLTLGTWRNHGGVKKVLYCYRHPMEVALSLKKRQHIPLWKGLRLWRLHVEQFLSQAAGLPLVMVNYHHLMSEGDTALEEMRRLFRFLQQPVDDSRAREILASVRDPGLHHHHRAAHALPPPVDGLWTRLNAMHSRFDRLLPFEVFDDEG